MRTALITGITGQDGQYMAELLLSKGYKIVGTTRSASHARKKLDGRLLDQLTIVEWQMADFPSLMEIIAQYRPHEFYNFSAFSSGASMFDNPEGICDINGLAVTKILEAIRLKSPATRFCQAGSSEMFGEAPECPQTENTPFQPRTPYGAAKLYAHWMTHIYRKKYKMFSCSAILFNHESPRRTTNFVSRKITHAAASIKLGIQTELRLGDLNALRDWGYAADYVDAMWRMLQADAGDDYVVATGTLHSVRELCQCAFSHVGLNYENYVKEDLASFRAPEAIQLVGSSAKLTDRLGWQPTTTFEDLVIGMVEADLKKLKSLG